MINLSSGLALFKDSFNAFPKVFFCNPSDNPSEKVNLAFLTAGKITKSNAWKS